MKSAFIREHGKEELLKLKRENYNLKLEDCVIGADQRSRRRSNDIQQLLRA